MGALKFIGGIFLVPVGFAVGALIMTYGFEHESMLLLVGGLVIGVVIALLGMYWVRTATRK